jgi:co-chaperonin GroES (HSP10)
MIRPYGDRILLEKLDGHGLETKSPGGIVLPAVEWKRGKTAHVADYFRARVLAVGSKVREVSEGDEVIVYTYSREGHGRVLVGWDTPFGLIVEEGDVMAVVDGVQHLPLFTQAPGSWAKMVLQ